MLDFIKKKKSSEENLYVHTVTVLSIKISLIMAYESCTYSDTGQFMQVLRHWAIYIKLLPETKKMVQNIEKKNNQEVP